LVAGGGGPLLRRWWKWLVAGGLGALLAAAAAVAQITGFSLKDLVGGQPHVANQPLPSTATPTVTPMTSTPTPTPTTPQITLSAPPPTSGGLAIQAFEGQWTWPYHEAFGLAARDVLAHGSLTYYGPGPVPAGQVAEIRFTSRTGDTLNGTVESVGPGTYLFSPGDPVSVTLVNGGKGLQLNIGQNNPASGLLSRV
jgi:hypothetical protein